MDDYSSSNCDHLGRSVCKIIKRRLGRAIKTTDRQQMVSCLVYIGAVKDNGSHVVVRHGGKSYYLPLCLDKHVVVSGVYRYSKNGPRS